MSTAVRANCFDASALVKRYVTEEGSSVLREYWAKEPTKFTTSFCFYETLTQLKVHHLYRKTLNGDAFRKANLDLCAWFSAAFRRNPELNFLSPEIFFNAQRIANKYQFDLSDAFQILSVKEGYFSPLCGDSKTILVTADRKLAKAGRAEGLRAWSVLDEPAP
jgi:predicted nucleic acid-binding protein